MSAWSWFRQERVGSNGPSRIVEDSYAPDLDTTPAGSSWLLRYGAAMGGVLVALLVRLALTPLVGNSIPLAPFFIAELIIAWAVGYRPALLALALGITAGELLILKPNDVRAFFEFSHQIRFWTFLLFGFLSAFFIESLRTAQHRAASLAAIAFAQREQFRTSLNSIADGVIVTDRSGCVIFLNTTAQRLIGCGEEVLGQDLTKVFRLVDPANHEPIEDPVRAALRTDGVVYLSSSGLLISLNGIERPIEERSAPVRDEQGRASGVVLIFRDVTQRQQDEEALRTSEALYRTLTNAIPQIVWTAGADGSTDYVNQQWHYYLGMASAQSLSAGWEASLHPAEMEAVHRAWNQSLQTQRPFVMEFRLRQSDGRYRWFLTRACRCAIRAATWSSGSAPRRTSTTSSGRKKRSKMPIAARTSSWQCWPTSCATPWRLSGIAWSCCGARRGRCRAGICPRSHRSSGAAVDPAGG